MARTLMFRLNISTELGDGDDVDPTIEYVTDWLTSQGYDSQLGHSHVDPSHKWHGGIVDIERLKVDGDPEWSVSCYDCDWTMKAPQSIAVVAANQHHNDNNPITGRTEKVRSANE